MSQTPNGPGPTGKPVLSATAEAETLTDRPAAPNATSAGAASRRARYEELALPLTERLYAMAYRLTGKSALAEDLVQEAFLTAWKNFDRYQAGTNFKAWIFQIMVFLRKNQRRNSKQREVSTDFTEIDPAAQKVSDAPAFSGKTLQADWNKLYPDLVEDEFKQALDKLEEDQRSVLLMVTLAEMSYQECAEALEIPIGTVMSRLFRARKQLQGELFEYAKARGLAK